MRQDPLSYDWESSCQINPSIDHHYKLWAKYKQLSEGKGEFFKMSVNSHKKGQNNAICSNMDGPGDCHTEWSKSDRERQIYDTTYMWNLKKATNELIYKRNGVTDVENKLMVTAG